jgi:hypothetical protein
LGQNMKGVRLKKGKQETEEKGEIEVERVK